MSEVTINNIKIGNRTNCYIISEIGAMYEDLEGMKQLIRLSKKSGADAVKLQTYRAETIAHPHAEFEFEDGSKMSQFEFFKKYEISKDDHKRLFEYANEVGITLFSTPSYYDDVDFLDELGVPAFKTGSDDLTNYPFLDYIASKGKPIIISTGMCKIGEVAEAVETVINTGNDQLILLQCTTSYPPNPEHINLNVMNTYKSAFEVPVGYSDHLEGIFPSVLAASMGACVIEKHVTLDRRLERPDYQVSIEPPELKEMVRQIRLIPVLQGSSVKKITPQEEKWRRNARKSLVAACDMKKGDILNSENIKLIRPGTGVHPRYLHLFVGRILKMDLSEGQIIPEDSV